MFEIKRINLLLFILIFWNSCYDSSELFSGNKILKFSMLVRKFTLSAVKSWPYNFPLYAEYSTKKRNNHPASSVSFLSYSDRLLVMQFFNHRLQGRFLSWLLKGMTQNFNKIKFSGRILVDSLPENDYNL